MEANFFWIYRGTEIIYILRLKAVWRYDVHSIILTIHRREETYCHTWFVSINSSIIFIYDINFLLEMSKKLTNRQVSFILIVQIFSQINSKRNNDFFGFSIIYFRILIERNTQTLEKLENYIFFSTIISILNLFIFAKTCFNLPS